MPTVQAIQRQGGSEPKREENSPLLVLLPAICLPQLWRRSAVRSPGPAVPGGSQETMTGGALTIQPFRGHHQNCCGHARPAGCNRNKAVHLGESVEASDMASYRFCTSMIPFPHKETPTNPRRAAPAHRRQDAAQGVWQPLLLYKN